MEGTLSGRNLDSGRISPAKWTASPRASAAHTRHARQGRAAALVLVLAAALWTTATRLRDPIDGEHYFRQTHVAANIDKYVSDGLSLRPRTYNQDAPLWVFDFPLYQVGVASVCRALGTDALVTARVLNLGLLVLTLLVLNLLMTRTRVSRVHRSFALVFYAFSPLNLYFFHTPLVDGLAVFLSLLSLVAFVYWRESEGWTRSAAFLVLLGSGIAATLIKNPVYLPVFVAIVWLSFRSRRSLAGRWVELGVFVATIALAVLAFRLYSNIENGVSGFLSSEETSQYFGDPADRLSLDEWRPIVLRLATRAVCPVGFALALLGAAVLARSPGRRRDLSLGLLVGLAAAIVIFFRLNRWHSYYQLPAVFPLAFLAGAGAAWTNRLAARFGQRLGRPWGGALPAAVLLVVVGTTAQESRSLAFGHSSKPGKSTERLVAAGEWIHLETEARDFVAYIVDDAENWNPAYLYFTRRDGYNVNAHRIATLPGLQQQYGRGRRFLVFCPKSYVAELSPRLEAMGATRVDQGLAGALFCLCDVKSSRPPSGLVASSLGP